MKFQQPKENENLQQEMTLLMKQIHPLLQVMMTNASLMNRLAYHLEQDQEPLLFNATAIPANQNILKPSYEVQCSDDYKKKERKVETRKPGSLLGFPILLVILISYYFML